MGYFYGLRDEQLGLPSGGYSVPQLYLRVSLIGCLFYALTMILPWISEGITNEALTTSLLGIALGTLLGGFLSTSSLRRLSDRKPTTVPAFYLMIILLTLLYFLLPLWITSLGWLHFISAEFITMGATANRVYHRFEHATHQQVKGGIIIVWWMEWLLPPPKPPQLCPRCGALIPPDAPTRPTC